MRFKFVSLFIFFFAGLYKLVGQPLTIDNSFNPSYDMTSANGIGCSVNFVIEKSNGNLVVGGEFVDFNYLTTHGNLIEVESNGNYIPSFFCDDCGYIHVLIKYLNYDFLIASGNYPLWRIDSLGNPFTYAEWNDSLNQRVNCGTQGLPLLKQDTTCLFGGSICSSATGLFQTETKTIFGFNSIGEFDSSLFHFSTDYVPWMIVESDTNHYVLCGDFHYYVDHSDTFSCGRICKVFKDFKIDTSFKTNYIEYGSLDRLISQDDGKVIASGFIKLSNGDTLSMIRFNIDGSIDTSFANYAIQTNYPEAGSVRAFCKTTDGGYLIGGGFTSYQGYPVKGIVKTDSNGNIDTNYFINYGIDSTCGDIPMAPPTVNGILHSNITDAYYVYGYFTGFNSHPTQPIIRLNGLNNRINQLKSINQKIKIFPNPATEQLTIELLRQAQHDSYEIEIEITDVMGRIIYKEQSHSQLSIIHCQLFSSGIYFVKVYMNDGSVEVRKFVKE